MMKTSESETESAVRLANTVLDTPSRDPDDDLATLARQFLRAREVADRLAEADAVIKSLVWVDSRGAPHHRSEKSWRNCVNASHMLAALARHAARQETADAK